MGGWLESLVPWGTEAIVWAQSLSVEWLNTVFRLFTFLGYKEFYLFLLPVVYWCVHKRIGASLGYVSLLSAWVNNFFKYLFAIPRPADPRIQVPLPEPAPSFPSGHAQNAIVNWGYLALSLRNWVFSIIAVIVIVGISLSRIVLGVHYPQDVIGGWLIGLVVLFAYVWAEPRVSRWLARQSGSVQLVLAAVFPVLLIFLHPADTLGRYPAEDAVVPMSALAGLGVGLVLERNQVRFSVEGEWWRRVLRFLVGLVVIVVLYLGPKLILPEEMAHGLDTGITFVRYALLGWAMAFLCPWLFVRLRLAEQVQP